MTRRARPEGSIQRAVFEHLRVRGAPNVFACLRANGGYRRPVEASILKGLGVYAGVPDRVAFTVESVPIGQDGEGNQRTAPVVVPATAQGSQVATPIAQPKLADLGVDKTQSCRWQKRKTARNGHLISAKRPHMANVVTDFRRAGQGGQRDTPKAGVSRPVPPLCPGQMSRPVPSLSRVPVGPRTLFANARCSPKMLTSEV